MSSFSLTSPKRNLTVFGKCLLIIASSLLAQASAQETDNSPVQLPPEELAKLPYLHFSSNNLGEADLFRMMSEESTIKVNGESYIGFTFWSTGLVEWLFINTPGDLKPDTWILVNSEGKQMDAVKPIDIPLDKCPRVVARYPQASQVSKYTTSGEALEERGRYHLLQRVQSDAPANYAICLASCSPKSYEAGRDGDLIRKISHTVLRDSSDVVIENMKDIRREKGIDAAVEYLTKEMELRVDDGENADEFPEAQRGEARRSFFGLYISSWYEGQLGGGRLDPDWAAAVYGVMYDVVVRRKYYGRTEVSINLTSSLVSAGRYGKLAEVFEIWKEGARLGGYNMDSTTYPDLGPAFEILPQVRKRDIPYQAPYKNATDYKSRGRFGSHFLECFENYARNLWYQGKWQESLEWLVWVHVWSCDEEGNPKSLSKGQQWHPTLVDIANIFEKLGFWEEALALHENALSQKITGGYEGKFITLHTMSILKLKDKIGMPMPEDTIEKIRACILQADGNLYQSKTGVQRYKTDLALMLIKTGQIAEGEALLNEMAESGLRYARIARLRHWVKTERFSGVEEELLKLLQESRETGRKMDEISFYQIYADFLEKQSRLGEALWVQREIVRLHESFNIFTHLPVELAKLAALMSKMGMGDESLIVAERARALLSKGGIPKHLVSTALEILDGITRDNYDEEKEEVALVEFQPLQSVIIPLTGASWVSHVTLTNPSDTHQTGTLKASGFNVNFQESVSDVDIIATLGGNDGADQLKVQIEPSTYKIIALNTAADFDKDGEMKLSWTSDQDDYTTETQIILEKSAGGTTKAIIQAGAYQLNPFYGIPVYHHYVDSEKSEFSQPMRFVSSQNARIEIYAMDGSPIGIDSQGNGSILDPGDEIFGQGDGKGNLRIPLTEGSASFMIRIYPHDELPAEGLKLSIDCLEDEKWEVYAEDQLIPAAKE